MVGLKGTAWQLGLESGAPKKRKAEQGGKRSKKRKLEKLENWGELACQEEENNIRSQQTRVRDDCVGEYPAWSN